MLAHEAGPPSHVHGLRHSHSPTGGGGEGDGGGGEGDGGGGEGDGRGTLLMVKDA